MDILMNAWTCGWWVNVWFVDWWVGRWMSGWWMEMGGIEGRMEGR